VLLGVEVGEAGEPEELCRVEVAVCLGDGGRGAGVTMAGRKRLLG